MQTNLETTCRACNKRPTTFLGDRSVPNLAQQILRTDASGMPLEWIDFRQAARLHFLDMIAYVCGEPLFTLHLGDPGTSQAFAIARRMISGKSPAMPGIGVRIEDCPVAVTHLAASSLSVVECQ